MAVEPSVPLSVINSKVTALNALIRRAEIERDALVRLRNDVVRAANTSTAPPRQESPRPTTIAPGSTGGAHGALLNIGRMVRGIRGPSDAILDLLRTEPQLRPAEVVKRLVGKVVTRADTPEKQEKVLFQTIANLRERGRLTANDDGRLTVVA